jgi:hypothetical protein
MTGKVESVCFKAFVSFLSALVLLTPGVSPQTRGNWQIEVADAGRPISFSSLVIDRFGNFHLVYSDRAGTVLRYAFRAKQEKRWDTTAVDTAGGSFDSLAVDPHGWAHIAYNSPKLTGLHYAFWDGKQWQKVLIDTEMTNHDTSIQLDSEGHPRISYYREGYADHRNAKYLKYAYFDGKTWYIQTVDHRAGTGRWSSTGLDRADRPYVSYSVATTGNLELAYLNQSKWEHAVADSRSSKSKSYMDCDSSLAIAAGGEPHIAYINATVRTVNYAWREGVTWHREAIDSLVSTGSDADRVSLKLDRNAHPHVVYYDSGSGALKYATRDDQGWHTEAIDNGDAGEYPSLSLDENDQPYVAYYAADARELRVAHRSSLNSVQKQ